MATLQLPSIYPTTKDIPDSAEDVGAIPFVVGADGQLLGLTNGVWTAVDAPQGFSGDYNDLSNKPTASDIGALPLSGGTLTGPLTVSGVTDVLIKLDCEGHYTTDLGLDYDRKRLITGGESRGASNQIDILDSSGQYFDGATGTIDIDYAAHGNRPFFQLWSAASCILNIVDDSGFQIGDVITIASNNQNVDATVSIQASEGSIYLPDGQNVAANDSIQFTKSFSCKLFRHMNSGWMMSF